MISEPKFYFVSGASYEESCTADEIIINEDKVVNTGLIDVNGNILYRHKPTVRVGFHATD